MTTDRLLHHQPKPISISIGVRQPRILNWFERATRGINNTITVCVIYHADVASLSSQSSAAKTPSSSQSPSVSVSTPDQHHTRPHLMRHHNLRLERLDPVQGCCHRNHLVLQRHTIHIIGTSRPGLVHRCNLNHQRLPKVWIGIIAVCGCQYTITITIC